MLLLLKEESLSTKSRVLGKNGCVGFTFPLGRKTTKDIGITAGYVLERWVIWHWGHQNMTYEGNNLQKHADLLSSSPSWKNLAAFLYETTVSVDSFFIQRYSLSPVSSTYKLSYTLLLCCFPVCLAFICIRSLTFMCVLYNTLFSMYYTCNLNKSIIFGLTHMHRCVSSPELEESQYSLHV